MTMMMVITIEKRNSQKERGGRGGAEEEGKKKDFVTRFSRHQNYDVIFKALKLILYHHWMCDCFFKPWLSTRAESGSKVLKVSISVFG